MFVEARRHGRGRDAAAAPEQQHADQDDVTAMEEKEVGNISALEEKEASNGCCGARVKRTQWSDQRRCWPSAPLATRRRRCCHP